jgi:nucleotide-binding universal stress UspA family protein
MESFMKNKNHRVLWAFDPFEKGVALDHSTARDLAEWAKTHSIEIEPVYAFTPVSPVEALATSNIQTKMARFFEKHGLQVKKPRVLHNRSYSLAKGIDQLLKHAQKTGAEMIVVSSHGRRYFPRLLLGSFAETLLNLSPIPVLFMNQHRRPAGGRFSKALLATDFSKNGERAYNHFIEWRNRPSNEIVIFNDAGVPKELRAYFGLEVGQPTLNKYLEEQESWARGRATEWLKNARQSGMSGISSVEQGYGSLTDSILGAARDNEVGLIVMSSERGPFEAALLGSQARKVFRASEFPVLVYGPRFEETARFQKHASKKNMIPKPTAFTKSFRSRATK